MKKSLKGLIYGSIIGILLILLILLYIIPVIGTLFALFMVSAPISYTLCPIYNSYIIGPVYFIADWLGSTEGSYGGTVYASDFSSILLWTIIFTIILYGTTGFITGLMLDKFGEKYKKYIILMISIPVTYLVIITLLLILTYGYVRLVFPNQPFGLLEVFKWETCRLGGFF